MRFGRRARYFLSGDGGLRITIAVLYLLVVLGGITTLANLRVFRDGVLAVGHQRISGIASTLAQHLPQPLDAEAEAVRLAPLQAGLGESAVIAIFDRQRGIILSLPQPAEAFTFPPSVLEGLDVGIGGQFIAPWPGDGVSRLWGFAPVLDGRPLAVLVGVPRTMVTDAVALLAWHLTALMAALACGAVLLAYLLHHISVRRRVEAELTETSRRAVVASEAKTAFLANMSHELRTPLTGVLGMADLLGRTRLDDDQSAMLGTIRTSARTLLTVLDDVLDVSHMEAGECTLQPENLDLHRLVAETVRVLCPAADGKGLHLELDVAEHCPRWVHADPARLQQVLFNLIGNAVKFTERGGVVVRLRREGVCVAFEVEDSGIGMDADTLARLFVPFTQGDDSATRRHGGAGLGLAIAKRLVTQMGGTLQVSSTLGQGTRFTFRLPLPTGTVPSGPPEPPSIAAARPLRVLLAEDNGVNQTLLRQLLQAMGHSVTLAENGAIALELAAEQDFDAVVMDMQMPVMDGETATKLIRMLPGERANLPVVALTADAVSEHHDRYVAAGLNAFLTKPVAAEVLARTLDEVTAPAPQEAPCENTVTESPEPAQSSSTAPVLDPAYLEDMRQWVGDATLVTLLTTAPDAFQEELTAIRAAWHDGNLQGVRENAHRLKGAAGSVGCRRLSDTAQTIQKITREDLGNAGYLSQLEAEVATAVAAATQWRPEGPERA